MFLNQGVSKQSMQTNRNLNPKMLDLSRQSRLETATFTRKIKHSTQRATDPNKIESGDDQNRETASCTGRVNAESLGRES